jgi:YD repeat-containing protein
MGSDIAKRFACDEENRLVSVTVDGVPTEDYVYDALGRRILTHDHTPATAVQTRHVDGAGFEVLAEYESSDNWETEDLAREFLWGDRFPEPLVLIDWTDASGDPSLPLSPFTFHLITRPRPRSHVPTHPFVASSLPIITFHSSPFTLSPAPRPVVTLLHCHVVTHIRQSPPESASSLHCACPLPNARE